MFAEGSYFYDLGAGKKYYGPDIGYTVDIYATAFPDNSSYPDRGISKLTIGST